MMAKGNFEELLTAQRLRGVWGRSVTPDTAVDTLNRVIKQADAGGTTGAGTTLVAASVRHLQSSLLCPTWPMCPLNHRIIY